MAVSIIAILIQPTPTFVLRRRLRRQCRAPGRPCAHLSALHGDAQLRRAHRLHGRQRRRLQTLLPARPRTLGYLLPPPAGLAICLCLWLSLGRPAMIAGSAWLVAGILYGAWKTRGFRGRVIVRRSTAGIEPAPCREKGHQTSGSQQRQR